MGEFVWERIGDWTSVAEDETFGWYVDWVFKPNNQTPKCVRTKLTIDVYGMSRGTGTKCAGGIDKEHLMGCGVVEGKSPGK